MKKSISAIINDIGCTVEFNETETDKVIFYSEENWVNYPTEDIDTLIDFLNKVKHFVQNKS